MSCMLGRHIDLVIFAIANQIVNVTLYKLLDQYCHKHAGKLQLYQVCFGHCTRQIQVPV